MASLVFLPAQVAAQSQVLRDCIQHIAVPAALLADVERHHAQAKGAHLRSLSP